MKNLIFWFSTLLLLLLSSIIYLKSITASASAFENYDEANMGRVFMEAEFLDRDILKISTKAGDMASPVIGLAFHLNYDSEKLAFLRYEPGDFLEKGGDPFYLVKNAGSKLIFGETLRRDDNFPLGDGELASFFFQIIDGTKWQFDFEKGVVSGLDSTRQDIDKILWENLDVDKDLNTKVVTTASPTEKSLLGYASFGKIDSLMSGRYLSLAVVSLLTLFLGGYFVYSKKQENKRHV